MKNRRLGRVLVLIVVISAGVVGGILQFASSSANMAQTVTRLEAEGWFVMILSMSLVGLLFAGLVLSAAAGPGNEVTTDSPWSTGADPALSFRGITVYSGSVIIGTALAVLLIRGFTGSWAVAGVVAAVATGLSVGGYGWLTRARRNRPRATG